MALTSLSDISGGGDWFKPEDHASAAAILFEPKSIEKNVRNEKYNNTRDIITGVITIFATEADVEAGKPSQIMQAGKLDKTALISTLERVMGGATVARVFKGPFKNGNTGWQFDSVPPAIEAKVAEYLDAREAEVAAAVASAPGFD